MVIYLRVFCAENMSNICFGFIYIYIYICLITANITKYMKKTGFCFVFSFIWDLYYLYSYYSISVSLLRDGLMLVVSETNSLHIVSVTRLSNSTFVTSLVSKN
ncbi:hypothetical protein RND81_08G103800 [Saponaria officinalis]|uniref:NADH dehydrogenase subunit 4L n=1 Tax=Saponaria officinalis TaxID=3572 RepID=A0AAW1J508_SAPOF